MNNLCLVINTCKHYYINIKSLLTQINEYNYPKENILIISGQEDEEESFFEDNVKVIKVRYTGLHLTSMIYINENITSFSHIKYWVFLPDTIKFGPNFYPLLTKYYDIYLQKENISCISFINPSLHSIKDTLIYQKNMPLLIELYLQEKEIFYLAHITNPYLEYKTDCPVKQTMDMGILHSNHIISMNPYLQNIKTYDTTMENLVRLKKQLIFDENTTLGIPPLSYERATQIPKNERSIIHPDHIKFITNHYEDLQCTLLQNGKIQEVYFVLLDLYKYQRNFNGIECDMILTC